MSKSKHLHLFKAVFAELFTNHKKEAVTMMGDLWDEEYQTELYYKAERKIWFEEGFAKGFAETRAKLEAETAKNVFQRLCKTEFYDEQAKESIFKTLVEGKANALDSISQRLKDKSFSKEAINDILAENFAASWAESAKRFTQDFREMGFSEDQIKEITSI